MLRKTYEVKWPAQLQWWQFRSQMNEEYLNMREASETDRQFRIQAGNI
jgi:hypothetical protein